MAPVDWNDRESVLEAVKKHGYALHRASENLKNDREFVLEAVKINGSALHGASEDLKNDREIVLEAVKSNGDAIEYASDNLKSDREFVLIALYMFRTYFVDGVKAKINPPVFKRLRKETKFKLVTEKSVEEFKKEALHCASENGFALAIRTILIEDKDLAHTTIARNKKEFDRPLHRAARAGHFDSCEILLDIGGGVKSKKGKTPLVLAEKSIKSQKSKLRLMNCRKSKLDNAKTDEFNKVIQLLRDAEDMIATGVL
jgi:hypothetical protein